MLTLKKITDKENAYGYEIIEILAFNYDGRGFALCRCDGVLSSFHPNDLNILLFGRTPDGLIAGKKVVYEIVN